LKYSEIIIFSASLSMLSSSTSSILHIY
jgi:hypothetical protein